MGEKARIYQKIKTLIDNANTIALSTHINPDGDAVGSILAMESILRRRGKQVMIICQDAMPDAYTFLCEKWVPYNGKDTYGSLDLSITVDCPHLNRLGKAEQVIQAAKQLVNIDHHVSNGMFAHVNFVGDTASSTGELVFDLVTAWGFSVDTFEAMCLFVAISTDTGSFKYSNVSAHTLEITAQLFRKGIDASMINCNLYAQFPLRKFKLFRTLLPQVTVDTKRRIGWCVVQREVFKEVGAEKQDTEGIVDFIRDIQGVEVAFLLLELTADLTKVSFRSKSVYDVNALAGKFGGGGHERAAGCVVSKPAREALALVLKTMDNGNT